METVHPYIMQIKMKNFDINEDPHRRFNPLINEWVLVSPHRAKDLGKDK